jgi:hypothetical protein
MDDGNGGRAEITLTVNLIVEKQLYLRQLPISQVSGFRDENTGAVIIRGFTTGNLDLIKIRDTWLKINDQSEAPYPPVMSVRALG